MKLAYLASCFFDSTDKIWMLRDSAKRFGIDLNLYGLGEPHRGFIDCKVTRLLPELGKLAECGYTHVLYTDGPDTFFVAGPEEIWDEYASLGYPAWLVSAESNCYPHTDLALKIPESQRYPCTGQYMGEIEAILSGWRAMRAFYGPEDNEQGWMLHAIEDGAGIRIDQGRKIFRAEADNWNPGDPGCVLHFNGGYHDPVTGREARMRPVWDKVYGGTA